MVSLQAIYIGSTVFSVGITIIDFLGLLGGSQDSGEGDGGDIEGGGEIDSDDLAADSDHTGEPESSHVSHHDGVAALSVLTYLRSFVYFCLGFGPTGWFAMATGRGASVSLLWALPAGVIAFIVARAFFRFQRSDTDSSLHSEELLFQRATVVVPLSHETMGKVRVQVGMDVTEQYALAADPEAQFGKGDTVWITNMTDECVYVEDEVAGKESEK